MDSEKSGRPRPPVKETLTDLQLSCDGCPELRESQQEKLHRSMRVQDRSQESHSELDDAAQGEAEVEAEVEVDS